MSITTGDVKRLLPVAVDGAPYREENGEFVGGDAARGWRIVLSNPRQRRIALLALPALDVTLTWWGYDEAAIEAFLERFHRGFQRAGG